MNGNADTNNGRYLQPLTVEGMSNVRKRVCAFARIPLVSFKKLRIRVGTLSAQMADSERAAQVLGHSPSSGGRVVRAHYWDVDKHHARTVAARVRSQIGLQSPVIAVPDLTEQFQQIDIKPHKSRILA